MSTIVYPIAVSNAGKLANGSITFNNDGPYIVVTVDVVRSGDLTGSLNITGVPFPLPGEYLPAYPTTLEDYIKWYFNVDPDGYSQFFMKAGAGTTWQGTLQYANPNYVAPEPEPEPEPTGSTLGDINAIIEAWSDPTPGVAYTPVVFENPTTRLTFEREGQLVTFTAEILSLPAQDLEGAHPWEPLAFYEVDNEHGGYVYAFGDFYVSPGDTPAGYSWQGGFTTSAPADPPPPPGPGVPVYTGYAPTGAQLPYLVHRPLFIGGEADDITGEVIGWDHQTTLYCCAGSVEAAHNLALDMMNLLQGARVAGTTLSTSMGYTGAQVEGHYESQVTIQLNTGGI